MFISFICKILVLFISNNGLFNYQPANFEIYHWLLDGDSNALLKGDIIVTRSKVLKKDSFIAGLSCWTLYLGLTIIIMIIIVVKNPASYISELNFLLFLNNRIFICEVWQKIKFKIHFPSLLKEMGKCVTAFRVVIFEQVIDQDSERIVMDSVDLHI